MNELVVNVDCNDDTNVEWLIDIAHDYAAVEYPIYFHTSLRKRYNNFCSAYVDKFKEECPVMLYTEGTLKPNSVVLVNDLFSELITTTYVEFLQRNCYKVFITIKGQTVDNYIEKDTRQITIFDLLEDNANES